MSPAIYNSLADARRRLRWLGMTAALFFGAATAHASPGRWHEDPEAGVRFRVPFSVYQTKTGEQVENLIKHQNLDIPAHVRYTSGVYGEGGLPYVLVWTEGGEAVATLPSRLSLSGFSIASVASVLGVGGEEPLTFSRRRLVALGPPFAAGDGVKARIIAQLTRGATVYLGYFYRDRPDVEGGVSVLAGSLTVAPARRLEWSDLPLIEKHAWPWLALLGVAMATAAVVTINRRVSRRNVA